MIRPGRVDGTIGPVGVSRRARRSPESGPLVPGDRGRPRRAGRGGAGRARPGGAAVRLLGQPWSQTIGRGTIDGNAANTTQNLVGHVGGRSDGFGVAADAEVPLLVQRHQPHARRPRRAEHRASDCHDDRRQATCRRQPLHLSRDIGGIMGRVNSTAPAMWSGGSASPKRRPGWPSTSGTSTGSAASGIGRANLDGTGITTPSSRASWDAAWRSTASTSTGRTRTRGRSAGRTSTAPASTRASSRGCYLGIQSLAGVRGSRSTSSTSTGSTTTAALRGAPPPCGGGGIGRANLDGTGVNQTFLASDHDVDRERVQQQPADPLRADDDRGQRPDRPGLPADLLAAPAAARGAVFWRPPGAAGTSNTVILAAGTTWTPGGPCNGIAAGLPAGHDHPDVDRRSRRARRSP